MMSKDELSLIYKIVKELESFNHPDANRIAKEICDFSNYDKSLVENIISRLKSNEPWEYIKGYTEFDGNKIFVNRSTLIPRLETLQIIDICNTYSGFTKIVDVGCGSGAIGISLAKRYPNLRVILSDISEEAIDMAKKNIITNKVNKIEVVKSNLLEKIETDNETLIIANLPYIPNKDYLNLEPSVLEYEPQLALEGGENGLEYIYPLMKEIIRRKIRYSIFEIDPSQQEKLTEYAINSNYRYEFVKDFRGLFRFFKFYL